MRYLKEIVRARRRNMILPNPVVLLNEYPRWKKFLRNTDVYKNALPWITFGAIDYLKKYLTPDMKVFEYGGGGSTLFFASRVSELTTVEHNKEWFAGLVERMQANNKVVWNSNYIEPESSGSTSQLKIDNPDDYFSDDENFKQHTFKKYASLIDKYPDEYFNVVLVDGRARPSCMNHSLKKVKKGGLLILDNADREYYLRPFVNKLQNYKLITNYSGATPYVPWFTQTNIWMRVS